MAKSYVKIFVGRYVLILRWNKRKNNDMERTKRPLTTRIVFAFGCNHFPWENDMPMIMIKLAVSLINLHSLKIFYLCL